MNSPCHTIREGRVSELACPHWTIHTVRILKRRRITWSGRILTLLWKVKSGLFYDNNVLALHPLTRTSTERVGVNVRLHKSINAYSQLVKVTLFRFQNENETTIQTPVLQRSTIGIPRFKIHVAWSVFVAESIKTRCYFMHYHSNLAYHLDAWSGSKQFVIPGGLVVWTEDRADGFEAVPRATDRQDATATWKSWPTRA